jgi:hypothetical protein
LNWRIPALLIAEVFEGLTKSSVLRKRLVRLGFSEDQLMKRILGRIWEDPGRILPAGFGKDPPNIE